MENHTHFHYCNIFSKVKQYRFPVDFNGRRTDRGGVDPNTQRKFGSLTFTVRTGLVKVSSDISIAKHVQHHDHLKSSLLSITA